MNMESRFVITKEKEDHKTKYLAVFKNEGRDSRFDITHMNDGIEFRVAHTIDFVNNMINDGSWKVYKNVHELQEEYNEVAEAMECEGAGYALWQGYITDDMVSDPVLKYKIRQLVSNLNDFHEIMKPYTF